jgi:predicted membrane protein
MKINPSKTEGFFMGISYPQYLLYTPKAFTAPHSTFSVKIILLAALIWPISIEQKNMQFHFQHLRQKIKPFHMFAAIYFFVILAGLIYKFFKD